MINEIIKFENVNFGYSKDEKILEHLNFSIFNGEFYFLTGKSGSGKTSLLKMIYMDERPISGKIYLFNKDISKESIIEIRKKIGIVLQKPFLINHLNILDNTLLPIKISGINPLSKIQEAVELLTWVGLKDCLHKYPREISIGEQHRASLARAVILKPTLILADEPTGNVDQETSNKINNLFLALNKLGTTIIFATHKKQDIQYLNMPSLNIQNRQIEKIIPT